MFTIIMASSNQCPFRAYLKIDKNYRCYIDIFVQHYGEAINVPSMEYYIKLPGARHAHGGT